MIKRTLYFGNPAYLSVKDAQMVVAQPRSYPPVVPLSKGNKELQEKIDGGVNEDSEQIIATIPIEDIGVVILDSNQLTITQNVLTALLENNAAVITCDAKRHPIGLLLPLESNATQSERFREQIESSAPLKKQLWQQTVKAKIANQAALLAAHGIDAEKMLRWAKAVRSGDPANAEGKAAAYYWRAIFPAEWNFMRDREGAPPNNLLNYGYAILRAVVARGLVASGLLPTLGIHHRNKYNAYCLADDIMEPYRPYVDAIVRRIALRPELENDIAVITPALKKELLVIPAMDIVIEGEKSPLMVGLQRTTSSLARCFAGEEKKIVYAEFIL